MTVVLPNDAPGVGQFDFSITVPHGLSRVKELLEVAHANALEALVQAGAGVGERHERLRRRLTGVGSHEPVRKCAATARHGQ